MNKCINRCNELHIEKAISNLKKNNMDAYFVDKIEEILPLVKNFLKENEVIGFGGSETLKQIGFFDFIKKGPYVLLDRDKEGLTKDERNEINRQALLSDTYFASANAITEHGELYEVDGNGNRIAAITFGPKQVIIIAGKNKVVANLRDAIVRVKNVAAPANTMRLKIGTYCNNSGICVNGGKCDDLHLMSANADSCPNSICSFSNIIGHQTNINRIKVIIVNEALGF
ncbi:MAG: lactate utilization protein [Spirochaetaceae bacterium]|nr:lactate utilization protein [Spirochaetaceae bacterium]